MLNGHSIKCDGSDYAIVVTVNSELNLTDCQNSEKATVNGVYVAKAEDSDLDNGKTNGKFNMYGGTITGNTASESGGGV